MMTVTAITPTCDRPIGFALLEGFMARQTRPPDQWIVADGGRFPVRCNLGQQHSHVAGPSGAHNFAANLTRATELATGDMIVVFEDDDWYAPRHLETLVARIEAGALIAGDDDQRYYNVRYRLWRRFNNVGGCFCQTAFHRSILPSLTAAIAKHRQASTYGIDTTFWRSVPRTHWSIQRDQTVLGIKGLPGQAGLGIGHRPDESRNLWTGDPKLARLREWIGDDVVIYEPFADHRARGAA